MRKSTILLVEFLISICSAAISGTEPKYKLSDIPQELRKNAKAVIRKNDVVFKVENTTIASKTVDYAITVLNKNGNDIAHFAEIYDQFSKVKNIKISLYNGDGSLIKKYSSPDIMDLSARAGYSIYESTRAKVLEPEYRTPPYTLEYSFEIEYEGLLSYPGFQPYPDYNISIQESSFSVIKPESIKVRYFEQNIPEQARKEISALKYFWKVSNLPALKEESFTQSFSEITPNVYTAPSDFEFSGYKGNSDSWENFGSWINTLNIDRDILSEETISKLNQLVAYAKDDYEKVAILYKYMQDKTRYVSIQIGIGGWQPFDAKTIDRLSYGDCKALANYMKSILKAVGIKSYYTLVNAGKDAKALIPDFPCNQFNHAILSVPLQNDTLWLECTNQQMPCGYIGKFTDNRFVLCIDEKGGHLRHTKEYLISENIKSQTTVITINNDGDATARKLAYYTGTYFDDLYRILYSDAEDKKKLIVSQIHIPSFELVSFNYTVDKKRLPKVTETIELQLPTYATKLNNTLIIPVNQVNSFPDLPVQNSTRKSNIIVRRAYQEQDSIILILPDDYSLDKIPEDTKFSTVFGEYSSHLTKQGNSIIYFRILKINKGNYPPSVYPDFTAFFENVSLNDDLKLLLKKKNM